MAKFYFRKPAIKPYCAQMVISYPFEVAEIHHICKHKTQCGCMYKIHNRARKLLGKLFMVQIKIAWKIQRRPRVVDFLSSYSSFFFYIYIIQLSFLCARLCYTSLVSGIMLSNMKYAHLKEINEGGPREKKNLFFPPRSVWPQPPKNSAILPVSFLKLWLIFYSNKSSWAYHTKKITTIPRRGSELSWWTFGAFLCLQMKRKACSERNSYLMYDIALSVRIYCILPFFYFFFVLFSRRRKNWNEFLIFYYRRVLGFYTWNYCAASNWIFWYKKALCRKVSLLKV